MFIDVHNDVLGIHGDKLDVSDNLDIGSLTSRMLVTDPGCTLRQS